MPTLQPSLRSRWSDRRQLRRTLDGLERQQADRLDAHLAALASGAPTVDSITMVRHESTLRLLRITFRESATELLAAVSDRALADLAALPLPTLITLIGGRRRPGSWQLDLETATGPLTLWGSDLVRVDD